MHVTDFVESYFDAWNEHDAKGIARHLTKDGIYCDVPENARSTHDELMTDLGEFFAENCHRYELVGEILTSQNTIAFQYQMTLFDRVGQRYSPDVVNGAEFMTLNGDAAITIMDYYDIPGETRPTHLANLPSITTRKNKYAKSGLDDRQLADYKISLEKVMHRQQAYLWSNLTLPKLADAVGCSANHLSQVINAGCGVSFFDYLNQHRIERAKTLLTQRDVRSSSILNIAFDVGFNSNSAFYAAFKKCVGQTPAQFRQSRVHKKH
jgi:AraC-like DNA-binding protein